MNEKQVRELFGIMHIGCKFEVGINPPRIVRPCTIEELRELLDSWEYKTFKKDYPNLSQEIESFLKYGGS